MSRQRRDPRSDRLAHSVPGTARPRFDMARQVAATGPGGRARRDPRAERAAQIVSIDPRLRLDRAASHPAPAAAPAAPALPSGMPSRDVLILDAPAFTILALAEPGQDRLSPTDRQILGAARLLAGVQGGVILVVDRPVEDAGAAGADRVIVLPQAPHPAARLALVEALYRQVGPRHVVASEAADGADLARRLAARLDCGFFPAVEQIGPRGIVRTLRGRGLDQVARQPAAIMTILPDMVQPYAGKGREARAVDAELAPPPSLDAELIRPQAGSLPLAEADFVVSAGNGIRDFDLFRRVAAALGGTPGASRMLCDAGHMPRAAQVGASGTVLAAQCYLALGIAGAPQHLQGIAGCEHVIAVNTDLYAAMVERAELAIVADAHPVMEALLRLLAEEAQA